MTTMEGAAENEGGWVDGEGLCKQTRACRRRKGNWVWLLWRLACH